MSEQSADCVSIHIKEKLAQLSPTPSEPCIFKVHDLQRKENESAYEPKLVAIGPYHHGKDNLQEMEEHKLGYLKQLLNRRDELTLDRCVMAMRALAVRARKCYAEPINFCDDQFLEMMILDGCFIIELFHKFVFCEQSDMDPHDPILQLTHIGNVLLCDLVLFENQLPFFILVELFNITKDLSSQDSIIEVALNFLFPILPGRNNLGDIHRIPVDHVKHLLGLVYDKCCSSFAEIVYQSNAEGQEQFIKCTTELLEAGIKFKKAEESTSLLDIKFKNGVMEISPLPIDDRTDIVFRNLIAYEQNLPGCDRYLVTDYARFMVCLINSAKDVEKLRHYGIIENWIGDDEVVATMFNKLGNKVSTTQKFCYPEVFNNVNKHSRRRWNIWLAKLRRNYFNNPWSIISFLAAILLLLLTLIQTIFSTL